MNRAQPHKPLPLSWIQNPNVVFDLSHNDATEATISPSSPAFLQQVLQTVTVTKAMN